MQMQKFPLSSFLLFFLSGLPPHFSPSFYSWTRGSHVRLFPDGLTLGLSFDVVGGQGRGLLTTPDSPLSRGSLFSSPPSFYFWLSTCAFPLSRSFGSFSVALIDFPPPISPFPCCADNLEYSEVATAVASLWPEDPIERILVIPLSPVFSLTLISGGPLDKYPVPFP